MLINVSSTSHWQCDGDRFEILETVFSFYTSKSTGSRRDLNSAFTIQILSPKIVTAISYVAYFHKPWKVKVATEVESPKRIHNSCDQTMFGESVICELDDGETESKMECFEDCATTMYICNCNRYRYFSMLEISLVVMVWPVHTWTFLKLCKHRTLILWSYEIHF